MITKYNNNLLMKLYGALTRALESEIKGINGPVQWQPMENLMELILLNNGCQVNQDRRKFDNIQTNKIIKGNIYVSFVRNWKGNEVNEVFDVIEFYGVTYLIIFTDYFKGINTTFPDEEDQSIEAIAKRNMGNSVYYDAICKIVNAYELITFNPALTSQTLTTTAAANNLRYAPSIIAILILNQYRPVTQEDIPDIPIDQVKQYLEIPPDFLLNGIRSLEDLE